MFLVVLEVGVEAREGRGADGVALASNHILRRVELCKVVAEEERADSRCKKGVCEVGRQAAQWVGGSRHSEASAGLTRWCWVLRGSQVHGRKVLRNAVYFPLWRYV